MLAENMSMDEVKSELEEFIEVSVISSQSVIDHLLRFFPLLI